MKIATTHVGSLPRSQAVVDFIFSREHKQSYDQVAFDRTMQEAVLDTVQKQVDAGINIVSDGETSKISYATYVKDRYTGFDGDGPRNAPADLKRFPSFLKRLADDGGTPQYARPMCVGDGNAVKFVPTTGKTRFTALASGEIDLLARNTTWTFSRDVDLKFEFVGVNYYDGQGFMAPKALGVTSAKDLDGATVCIQTGTTTELNLADFFRSNNISYEPVPIETNAEAQAQYLAGACDVFTTDASGLASTRATFENPDDHIVLPEIVSKEPLGPLVRHGDNNWGDIARWTLNALITAEELGVTSANVAEHTANAGNNPEVNRLLGTEGDLGGMLGLDKQWASRAIAVNGNYGEIFEKNIGVNTPIGIARGLNASWTNGGLIYSAPFR